MPSSRFYRSRVVTIPPDDPPSIINGPYIPNGAVIFGYNSRYDVENRYRLDATIDGNIKPLLKTYYTKYNDLMLTTWVTSATYGIGNGASSVLTFLRSVSTNSNWVFKPSGWDKANTAFGVYQTTLPGTPPVYATLLDGKIGDTNYMVDFDQNRLSGRHGYLSPHPMGQYDMNSPSRAASDVPTILGAAPGDTLSTTDKYTIHNKAHDGHYHRVSGLDVDKSIININFGKDISTPDTTLFETGGLHLLPVIPYRRDFNAPKQNTLLTSLPKGVLVFGQDLSLDNDITIWTRDQYNPTEAPNGDYTRHDYDHEAGITTKGASASSDTSDMNDNYNTFAQVPLYLTVSTSDVGLMVPSQTTFTVNAVSNVSGLHTHGGTTAFKSNKTGQKGDVLGPSGAHTHTVYYTGNLQLKAKWLNGWITLKDNTPLANGIIIGFSPIGTGDTAGDALKTDANWLPPYWHFCDGTNGTPDLRGYHIAVNMYESEAALHGTEVAAVNQLTLTSIDTSPSSGEIDVLYTAGDGSVRNAPRKTHSHVIGTETGTGTPIKMTGSHAISPFRFHYHSVSPQTTFTDTVSALPPATSSSLIVPAFQTITYQNIRTNTAYSYNPDNSRIAFIMLNKALP